MQPLSTAQSWNKKHQLISGKLEGDFKAEFHINSLT